MQKIIRLFVIFVSFLTSCKPQQKMTELRIGDMFPTIEAQTLDDRKIVFPNDTKGNITVLATGFAQEVQEPINTWTEFILKNYPTVNYFEVPIGNRLGSLFSKQIDNAMKGAVPKELHPKTATYYGGLYDKYKIQFGAREKETCYVFLMDKEGRIAFKAVGPVAGSIEVEFEKVYRTLR